MGYIKSVVTGTISILIISMFIVTMGLLPTYLMYHFQNKSISDFLLSLLNFIFFYQDEGVFSWMLWYVGGVISGLVARSIVKGILSAFSVPIILITLYWILLVFPLISAPIDMWEILDKLYYLTDVALKFALISAVGGILGGAATRQR